MKSATVYGAGVYGLCLAWRLVQRGYNVHVRSLEPPLGPGTSSIGGSRIYRFAYFESAAYVPLMQRAFGLWGELASELGTTVHEARGVVYAGPGDGDLLRGVRGSAEQYGLRIESGHPVPEPLPDGYETVFEPDAGFLYSDRICLGLFERLQGLGVQFEYGVPAVADAGLSFFALGPGMKALCPKWSLTVTMQTIAWLEGVSDTLPVFGFDGGQGSFLYGIPAHADCTLVKVGEHLPGPVAGLALADPFAQLPGIASNVARFLGPEARVVQKAACRYTNTVDGDFIVDWVRANALGINACSGHGFKFAPAVADLAIELAESGVRPELIQDFGADRFSVPE
ncbi:FAD dependent oxidoreductase [Fimbriimonadaceae bacterium]